MYVHPVLEEAFTDDPLVVPLVVVLAEGGVWINKGSCVNVS